VTQPEDESIIRQVVMWSNGPGVQPKQSLAAEVQFDELMAALDIPAEIPREEKLAHLRACSPDALIDAGMKIAHHQFRPWTDGIFVSRTLFADIDSGDFARRLRARNIRLMTGECRDEHFVYGTWHTPANSLADLRKRIEADYPVEACDALVNLYYPSGALPKNCKDWRDAFGRLYADIQIHMLQRGLFNALSRGGAGDLIYRYRMEYRLKCVDKIIPPRWGVTHASDMPLWFWGNGFQIEPEEKDIVTNAFLAPLCRFVRGDRVIDWGTNTITQSRRLNAYGRIDIWDDNMWEDGLKVWETLKQVGSTGQPSRREKL
jgi:carboxylesterase type B